MWMSGSYEVLLSSSMDARAEEAATPVPGAASTSVVAPHNAFAFEERGG